LYLAVLELKRLVRVVSNLETFSLVAYTIMDLYKPTLCSVIARLLRLDITFLV